MKRDLQPIVQDLVLVGGGHSHAIALRMFGMNPLPGIRLTLISDASSTPYSGMLPGHVAGFYSYDECHIDLRRLCQFAGAQFYVDAAVGLDLDNNRIICANRPPVRFDVVSIDIGSTPEKPAVLGDGDVIIPAKPVGHFLERWERIVQQVTQNPENPICLGIVGGGVGGVELALNMQSRLQAILKAAHQPLTNLTLHLVHRGAELLSGHNYWVRSHLCQLLTQRNIHLHLSEEIYEVQRHYLRGKSGLELQCDFTIWVTRAAAPDWLGKAGLDVDEDGFVQVDDGLRSQSHPQVFAAGDIATMVNHPRPKAGVFAVRQGKPLAQNLRRTLEGKPLKPFYPQRQYLSLIGTGDRSAIASRGALGWHSHLLWRWKDQIDRAFMDRFSQLSGMGGVRSEGRGVRGREREERSEGRGVRGTGRHGDAETRRHGDITPLTPHPSPYLTPHPSPLTPHPSPPMRCAGCGAKVGSATLNRVLERIQQTPVPIYSSDVHARQFPPPRADILLGLNAPDDAAVVQVPDGMVMVQTIDYFPALIDDPFVFGQISANHALSDLFAMGAQPQSALAIATIPYASEAIGEETLYQLLSGALKVLHQAKAELIGGHTTEGAELIFGLSCNGLAVPNRLLRKGGMQPGQVLILTKAIGTGALFAANMRQAAKGRWIDGAIASMLQSNQQAANCLLEHGATACTDVTGFGLGGHLIEMIRASAGVAVNLDLVAIPVLEGALEVTQSGIVSSLYRQNSHAMNEFDNIDEVTCYPRFPLLFDPQTSGGLLATVPTDRSDRCLAALKASGYSHSAVIGHTLSPSTASRPIVINTKCRG